MRAKYLPFELRSPLRYHDSECVPILPANEITKIISIKWYNDYYFGRLTACPERIQLKILYTPLTTRFLQLSFFMIYTKFNYNLPSTVIRFRYNTNRVLKKQTELVIIIIKKRIRVIL